MEFPGDVAAEVSEHSDQFVVLSFDRPLGEEYFDTYGHVPLPPYIRRQDRRLDVDRYQTVYAASAGSVAAPMAKHILEAWLRIEGVEDQPEHFALVDTRFIE